MAKRRRVRWAGFTIGEVAQVVGRSPKRVQRDARKGVVDRRDLASVVRYVAGNRDRGASEEARKAYLALGLAMGVDVSRG